MFTGIVEGPGKVLQIKIRRGSRGQETAQLAVKTPFSLGRDRVGGSIAVNGCCLTMAQKEKDRFWADLSPETLRVTNLGRLRPGGLVNLERPMRLGGRLGGHLVQGHVDGLGRVRGIKKNKEGVEIIIGYPPSLRPLLIPKGSVAIDGVSMTVNKLTADHFSLVVIPHTIQQTNFQKMRKGDVVNLEADMIGKYVKASLRPL